jgi:spore maturation protein CgeB
MKKLNYKMEKKKIIVVGKFYDDSFANHIFETLKYMNHDVYKYEISKNEKILFLKKNKLFYRIYLLLNLLQSILDSFIFFRTYKQKKLIKYIATYNSLDLILFTYDFLWPIEITEVKKITKAKIALWYPDALSTFGKGFFMNADYDFLFFKDPYIVKNFNNILKSQIHYLPECFNPNRHTIEVGKYDSDFYKCDITTAGNQHSWRNIFFEHLKGYDIKFWGLNPPIWMPRGLLHSFYQGKPVYNTEKAEAFINSKIVLNNLHYSEIEGLNVRCFEAAGIGAFQIVDWRPGLNDLFIENDEIVSFKTIDELKDKLNFYLSNEHERNRIAINGKKRAFKDHTYQVRLQKLLNIIFN